MPNIVVLLVVQTTVGVDSDFEIADFDNKAAVFDALSAKKFVVSGFVGYSDSRFVGADTAVVDYIVVAWYKTAHHPHCCVYLTEDDGSLVDMNTAVAVVDNWVVPDNHIVNDPS